MFPPIPVLKPPFNLTRASHVVLNVADLDASLSFYTELAGLVLTAREGNVAYLRGIEEACHHSLVLQATGEAGTCSRIGLRALTEDDLKAAYDYFSSHGLAVAWVTKPHQGKTLHFTDPHGFPIEICAHMSVEPRQITNFHLHKGGSALRLDHFQLLTPHVNSALEFYTALGFRLTEYISTPEHDLRGVFLQRKGNPHDLVFFNGIGPRIHHFAFMVPEVSHILRACDIAGELGYGEGVERGPGRHGPGHALFSYFRDPDGHRVELFNTHYQTIDLEGEPVRWSASDPAVSYPWGLPAQRSWFEEATAFENVPLEKPAILPNPTTLERFLSEKR